MYIYLHTHVKHEEKIVWKRSCRGEWNKHFISMYFQKSYSFPDG